jgi:hypothetical protein
VPGKTKKLTVTNVAPVAVIALTETYSIVMYEDANVTNWPTSGFDIMKPSFADDKAGQPIGKAYEFTKSGTRGGVPDRSGRYQIGEVAGYIQLPSSPNASTTFIQEES